MRHCKILYSCYKVVSAVMLYAFEKLYESYLFLYTIDPNTYATINMAHPMIASNVMGVWENTAYIGEFISQMEQITGSTIRYNRTRVALLKWSVQFVSQTLQKEISDPVFQNLENRFNNFSIIGDPREFIPVPEPEPVVNSDSKPARSIVYNLEADGTLTEVEKEEEKKVETPKEAEKPKYVEKSKEKSNDFDPDSLKDLSRKELQDIAERYNIPTNQNREDLIRALKAKSLSNVQFLRNNKRKPFSRDLA